MLFLEKFWGPGMSKITDSVARMALQSKTFLEEFVVQGNICLRVLSVTLILSKNSRVLDANSRLALAKISQKSPKIRLKFD